MNIKLIDLGQEKKDPIKQAKQIKKLIEDNGFSVKDAGLKINITPTTASHLLRLLKLDNSIQKLLSEKILNIGHGKALASLDIQDQKKLVNKILKHRPQILSIRKTEEAVKKIKFNILDCTKSPDHLKLEETITDIVGSLVEINETPGKKECGQVVINYQGYGVLDGILERLGYREQA